MSETVFPLTDRLLARLATQATSDKTPQNPSKPSQIMDLSLLTYIFGKSAKRRFSWCNSQRLSPSGRRDMSETVFGPLETSAKPHRHADPFEPIKHP